MSLRALSISLLVVCAALGCTSREPDPDGGADAIDADVRDSSSELDASALDASMLDASDAGALERCDEEGEACCLGATCGGGLLCVDGLCGSEGCGAIAAPCCELSQCDLGAVCEDGTCVEAPCGVERAACCPDAPACMDDLECLSGTCGRCGAADQDCCPGDVCDEGLSCVGNLFGAMICVAPIQCGETGAPCCTEGEPCGAGLGCVSFDFGGAPELLCLPGPTCGGDGRACCADAPRCGPGLDCNASAGDVDRCRRCGEYDLACCVDGAPPCGPGLSCSSGVCTTSVPSPS